MNVFWFRRDLRTADNAGLYHALKAGKPVFPLFIFDKNILDQLEDKRDKRVSFIYDHIVRLDGLLKDAGSSLHVFYGTPADVFRELSAKYNIEKVFTNRDYEPYARDRDEKIASMLKERGIGFRDFKDQVIFEQDEVVKDDGKPYTVYTPYSNKWKQSVTDFYLKAYPTRKYFGAFAKLEAPQMPALKDMGFEYAQYRVPAKGFEQKLATYDQTRDFPALDATTHLGVHLRFGTISIRMLARQAREGNATFLNELIWREFFTMILWHFPRVVHHAFRVQYDGIKWRNDEEEFRAWCAGKTGYPLVDAGIRQLNETGFMHNRVRMVTANFLTKLLLVDWRWGEAYFAQKLLDYELASNNGNWQWAAGSGCDASPYFRIFNPQTQIEKFDPDGAYIREWVAEYGTDAYPPPLVDYKEARARALKVYADAVKLP